MFGATRVHLCTHYTSLCTRLMYILNMQRHGVGLGCMILSCHVCLLYAYIKFAQGIHFSDVIGNLCGFMILIYCHQLNTDRVDEFCSMTVELVGILKA